MSDEAPIPISATFEVATSFVVITFDKPLQNGVSLNANWRVYRNLLVAPAQNNAVIAGNTVTFQKSGFDVPTGLPNGIEFVDVVHDLFGADGTPVQAFLQPFIDI